MQLSGLFITNENATLPLKKKYEYSGQLQKNKTSKVWVRKSTCPQNCLEMFSTIRTDLNTRSPVTENALNCNGVCLLRKGSRPEETGAGGPPRRCGFSKHTSTENAPGRKASSELSPQHGPRQEWTGGLRPSSTRVSDLGIWAAEPRVGARGLTTAERREGGSHGVPRWASFSRNRHPVTTPV